MSDRGGIDVKVVLVGSTQVGKTSLVNRIVHDSFDPSQLSTVGAAYGRRKVVSSDQLQINLQIWDTSGQERFRALTPVYFRGAQVAIIVYGLDNADSFHDVDMWYEELKEHVELSNLPLVYLVGNKSDLEIERKVDHLEAEHIAQNLNATHFETSALTSDNVSELVQHIADRVGHVPKPTFTLTTEPLVNQPNAGCC
jgi:Ras-related protein Rab-5C